MFKFFKVFSLFILFCPLLAHSATYLVVSKYIVEDIAEPKANVTESPNFKSSMEEVKIIAVKAPDFCINQSASTNSGTSAQEQQVLKTNCGVEMALIEKNLAKSGFIVVSWKVLNNKVASYAKSEEDSNKTPIDAAKALKADALFQINSLETTNSLLKTNARWERSYYKSNRWGEKRKPAPLRSKKADMLDALSKQEETKRMDLVPQRLSATVDASVTLVKNGQAIWFYDWNHSQPAFTQDGTVDILAMCGSTCSKKEIQERSSSKIRENKRREAVSTGGDSVNERVAIHNQLLKDIVSDMVLNFSNKS